MYCASELSGPVLEGCDLLSFVRVQIERKRDAVGVSSIRAGLNFHLRTDLTADSARSTIGGSKLSRHNACTCPSAEMVPISRTFPSRPVLCARNAQA